MEELTKTDCFVLIQALNAYDIECAKMFTRISDPYNTNHKAVLQLEEFDEVHGLIGKVRNKMMKMYTAAKVDEDK